MDERKNRRGGVSPPALQRSAMSIAHDMPKCPRSRGALRIKERNSKMEYFLDKIVPPLLQVVATFIVFALGYKLNEKTKKDERALVKAEEEKKKENLKLMLSEELKENYPILLELTRIDYQAFTQTDNAVSKLSFPVYQEYLNCLDALEPSEIRKILAAYSFMKKVVNQYNEQVVHNRSSVPIHQEWYGDLCKNLENVATALKIFDNGEQFVMESLVRAVEESYGSGYYFLFIFDQLVKFGNRVIPDLIKMLDSEYESISREAFNALKRIDTPEALKAVQAYENLTP